MVGTAPVSMNHEQWIDPCGRCLKDCDMRWACFALADRRQATRRNGGLQQVKTGKEPFLAASSWGRSEVDRHA